MKKILAAVVAAFLASAAYAQNSGTVTNHAFAIGKGPNVSGYTSLLCASGQLAVGGSGTDPVCRTVSGDATLSAAGVLTIAANAVTNAKAAQMAANTIKGNNTGGTANAADLTGAQASAILAASQSTAEAAVSTATLNTPQGTAQAWVANVQTFGRNIAGRNGGFEVWQRLVGGATTIAVAASSQTYTADGWYVGTGAGQASTVTQVAGLTNGSRFAAQVQRNSGQTGGGQIQFAIPLDTDELSKLRGNAVVASFTAKAGANWSPTSGTLTAILVTGTGAGPAKRGGVAYTGETIVLNQSFNLAPGGAVVRGVTTVSGAVPANITQAELQFAWTPVGTAGAADFVQIDDVQLEVVPTGIAAVNPVFERTDYAWDLHRCQRFLPVYNAPSATSTIFGFGQAYTTSNMFFVWTFAVPTRAPITGVTVSNAAHFLVANANSTTSAATAVTFNTGSNYTASVIAAATGTPLIAGNASAFQSSNAAAQILFTGAEI